MAAECTDYLATWAGSEEWVLSYLTSKSCIGVFSIVTWNKL